MSAPVVTIIGSTGYVGKCLMPAFLKALGEGRLKELRVLTTHEKLNNEQIQSYISSGAKAVAVSSYEDTMALSNAFERTDVAVSTLGSRGENLANVRSALLDALVAAKVKVYFPSEFGAIHSKAGITHHPAFDDKIHHFETAKEKGLNPIRIQTGGIMEIIFGPWIGLDNKSGVWTVVGNGADIPCAVTSERDMACFTLEAVLLAHSDISKCPDELEVFSDMRTLREYAKTFEKVTGSEIKIQSVPLDEFRKEYNKDKDFAKVIMLLFAEGAFDYSKSNGNELLNPKESVWKLKKIEEFVDEAKSHE